MTLESECVRLCSGEYANRIPNLLPLASQSMLLHTHNQLATCALANSTLDNSRPGPEATATIVQVVPLFKLKRESECVRLLSLALFR